MTYPIATVENGLLQFQMGDLRTELPIAQQEREGFLPFTVMTPDDEEISIWIEPKTLMETFEVSEWLITTASKANHLMLVILYELIENNGLLASKDESFHLSKLDYLKLHQNIYIQCDLVVSRNALIVDGTPLLRVERTIRPEQFPSETVLANERDKFARISAKFKQLRGIYHGVAEPVLVTNYTSPHNRLKSVIFYRSYPTMRNALSSGEELSEETKSYYAMQLLTHPALMEGTHNYLNPETIFIKGSRLIIGGMDYFAVDKLCSPIISPITAWSAPEYCRDRISFPNKAQVWSIAVIIWCIFHHSLEVPLTPATLPPEMTDEELQSKIMDVLNRDTAISHRWLLFLSHLLIINPWERPNMEAACKMYQSIFFGDTEKSSFL